MCPASVANCWASPIRRLPSSRKSCHWQFFVLLLRSWRSRRNGFRIAESLESISSRRRKPFQPHQMHLIVATFCSLQALCLARGAPGGAGGNRNPVQHAPTSTFRDGSHHLTRPSSLQADEAHGEVLITESGSREPDFVMHLLRGAPRLPTHVGMQHSPGDPHLSVAGCVYRCGLIKV